MGIGHTWVRKNVDSLRLKLGRFFTHYQPAEMEVSIVMVVEGSLEVKLPTIWRDEKQSRAEAERRERLEERRVEEKE